jgi:hypothetical protein
MALDNDAKTRLRTDQNIWVGSVRLDGRPHLSPVWFVYLDDKLFICIDPNSVKARNLAANPQIVLALEAGLHPVICEGTAASVPRPYPPLVTAEFFRKYEWEIDKDSQYNHLIEITPQKWLVW